MATQLCGWTLEPQWAWQTIDSQIQLRHTIFHHEWIAFGLDDTGGQCFHDAGCKSFFGGYVLTRSLKESVQLAHDIIDCNTRLKLDPIRSGYNLAHTAQAITPQHVLALCLRRTPIGKRWRIGAAEETTLPEYYAVAQQLHNRSFATRRKALEAINELVEPPTPPPIISFFMQPRVSQ